MKKLLTIILVIAIAVAAIWLADEENAAMVSELGHDITESVTGFIPSPGDFIANRDAEPPAWLDMEMLGEATVTGEYVVIVTSFFHSRALVVRVLFYLLLLSASIGVLASHGLGIYNNRSRWLSHRKQELMYSFFVKSGNYRREVSWSAARNLNSDYKWWAYSFAGLAYRLGNYVNKSGFLMFALSIVYIPMACLGFIEMIMRRVIGFVWFLLTSLALRAFFFATRVFSAILCPVSVLIDKSLRKKQYCPHCYDDFMIPGFYCNSCNHIHMQLTPSECGVLFARCQCNMVFLPTSVLTGRSRYKGCCPTCKGELAAANVVQHSIQLVGGTGAGRTSFLSAFTHEYKKTTANDTTLTVIGKPRRLFRSLEKLFQTRVMDVGFSGVTQTYSLVHKHGKGAAKDSLVFYDIPGDVIINGNYEKSPKNFGFCNGILFIIDPLSAETGQLRDVGAYDALANHSYDDATDVIAQFIQQFEQIRGVSAKKMIDIPIAVVINKMDVKVVWDGLNTMSKSAKGNACRDYLIQIGLGSAVNHITANFNNVGYFCMTSTGASRPDGHPFEPTNVIAPVKWLAQKGKARIVKYMSSATSATSAKGR